MVEFKHPKELAGLFDLAIGTKGTSDEALLKACKDTIKYSVKTSKDDVPIAYHMLG